MVSELRTATTVHDEGTAWERTAGWVLLTGDRRVLAGGLVVGITSLIWALIAVDVLAVGPDSSVASLFGSGLTAGVVTLLTIALSINQLVLSRVFGSVDVLENRLSGSRELRQRVESNAEVPSSPNDPAAFLSLVATTLTSRANGVVASANTGEWEPPEPLRNAVAAIATYGENLNESLESNADMTTVLDVILGPEYAVNIAAVQHLQTEYAASIPTDVVGEFEAIEELLESIAIVRQFYKTIAIQQDLATLSRLLVYSGVTALVTVISVTLIYQTSSVTLPEAVLPYVVSGGIGIIVAPLALFVAYILRAATVARQTVSVGPFVPPKNQR